MFEDLIYRKEEVEEEEVEEVEIPYKPPVGKPGPKVIDPANFGIDLDEDDGKDDCDHNCNSCPSKSSTDEAED